MLKRNGNYTHVYNSHIYVNSAPPLLPSVTQIISNLGLTADLGFLDPIYRSRGTAVHSAIELILNGHEPALRPLEKPYSGVEKYEKQLAEIPMFWKAMQQARQDIGIEGRLYECRFNVAGEVTGKFDFAGYLGGEPCFCDWKTGSSYAQMTALQLAAYEDLSRRGKPVNPEIAGLDWLRGALASGKPLLRRGLQVQKTGKYKLHSYTSMNESYDDPIWVTRWAAALCLYNSVPDHKYLVEGKEKSRLKDLHWAEWRINKSMGGKAKERARAAGEVVYALRRQYGLL